MTELGRFTDGRHVNNPPSFVDINCGQYTDETQNFSIHKFHILHSNSFYKRKFQIQQSWSLDDLCH